MAQIYIGMSAVQRFNCSKSIIETLEKGVKYGPS